MKKFISLAVMLMLLLQLAGCGMAELVGAVLDKAAASEGEPGEVAADDTGQPANTTLSESGDDEEYMPTIPDNAEKQENEEINKADDSDKKPVITLGEERIFFDNSQTAYYFLSSPQYISLCHSVFQSESTAAPSSYTLQIKNGAFDEAGNYIGYLHWQETDWSTLRTCFTDKALYTFAQDNKIPKLDDKGPLGLIFEDDVLDPDNLNIIFSDLMENNFGASQIAAKLAGLLTEKENTELRIFQFDCEGFSGSMSFPSYSTEGTIVRTVEKYRGSASMYIVAVGPTADVEDFASRLEGNLPSNIKYNQAVYANGDSYPGETGIGDFKLIDSLDQRVSFGSCDTLNYTVNAEPVEDEELVFSYNTDYTVDETDYQICFYAEYSEDSPLFNEDGEPVFVIDNMKVGGDVLQPEHNISISMEVREGLPARSDGKASDNLAAISDKKVLYITVRGLEPMVESITDIEFDLVVDMDATDWISGKSATIYEFQSVVSLLPQSETAANRLVWRAGATDILTRTLDLVDVDNILSSSVTKTKTLEHFSLTVKGPADTSGRWDMVIYATVGIAAAAVAAIVAFTFMGSNTKKKKRRR